jgi:hypothetical protein
VVLPVVADDSTHIGSSPFSTVTRLVLFETHVAVAVTSCVPPPETVAVAVKQSVAVELSARLTLVGLTVSWVTLPSVIVAVAVPVALPEDAVIVALPTARPFSKPPLVIVAVLVSELDQHTVVPVQLVPPVRVYVFPSLSVPTAFNCAVLFTLTDGLDGSTVIEVIVGFTKKPLQPTPTPKMRSVANAPASRRFRLFDDMV